MGHRCDQTLGRDRDMKIIKKIAYFPTLESAEEVVANLPPFTPSKYLTEDEIKDGYGEPIIFESDNGFVIQLGSYGNYYPAKTADFD